MLGNCAGICRNILGAFRGLRAEGAEVFMQTRRPDVTVRSYWRHPGPLAGAPAVGLRKEPVRAGQEAKI